MTQLHTDAVWRAIKQGTLQRPDACEDCGQAGRPHAHHDDYSKPLDVRWLCPRCHRRWHVRNEAKNRPPKDEGTIFVRFDLNTYRRITELAKAEHRTFGAQVNHMIERQLKENA